ncbi:MAG: hypothetical protein WCH46_04220 [bacterium]
MRKNLLSKTASRAIYIIASVLFLVLIVGHEFFWRFEPNLTLAREVTIRDSRGMKRMLLVKETNPASVDTTRRDFQNNAPSLTRLSIILSGSNDSIVTTISGKYFSDFREIHLATDSSSQIMLIPNSAQKLPAGWARIIYLRNDSTLAIKEFSGYFIGDIDKDGSEEVNITGSGWMKLDVASGEWTPTVLHPTP